jgi:hypothetical protein
MADDRQAESEVVQPRANRELFELADQLSRVAGFRNVRAIRARLTP